MLSHRWHKYQQLQETSEQNSVRQGHNRDFEEGMTEKRGSDQRQVQHDGRKRGEEKMTVNIQYTREQGQDTDQQDVGEHDPVESIGQFELARHFSKTGRNPLDDPR